MTQLLAGSFAGLQPNSADTTNGLLSQIAQQLALGSNSTHVDFLTPPFVAPLSAVVTNALWTVSLILSLTAV